MTIPSTFAKFVLSFVVIASAQQCPADAIADPPVLLFDSSRRGYLEFGEALINLQGAFLRTRSWRDAMAGAAFSIPGPVVELTAGLNYTITVRNALPVGATSTTHNIARDPNIMNLHTHGLHVSGETPSDDVTRL